ncbi:uncharacterized protein LOC127861849 isoform X4 [Dreissena polymorpha]|uniref:uncharacterized protein LOC127861849 isoform X4 n=1 Tax=Dreissena polymorpha TaxID=45954 RepID=UPI0022651C91|nr:uncharacterized protein LOC127861849 isoform X4 [Dreissena polymorpha]
MSLVKVGDKAPVFVTHLEFVGPECHAFCQFGNVGNLADTLAERIAEVVENGMAGSVSRLDVGVICLALFHEDNSWYRGRVVRVSGQSVVVFFIDYGNTETVPINNVREAPEYVLSIPALSTNCIVSDCTPLSGESWSPEEKKKYESLLISGEFNCEVIDKIGHDVNHEIYKVKLFNIDDPNTPLFVRPASGASQSLKYASLNNSSENEVFISFVESSQKFYVQLKNQEDELHSLMNDVGACFAEDLPSTGDIVNPVNGQVCAACFSEDGAFYRGIVRDIKGDWCNVFFVDYGNSEKKSIKELFTLPQALCKLPAQAVLCSYKGGSGNIEDDLHDLSAAEKPLVLRVLSGNQNSGYVVTMDKIEEKQGRKGNQSASAGTSIVQPKAGNKLWQSYSSVVMLVDSIYDVCISHIDHPGQFYVQLLGNAKTMDTMMQAIDEVAHNYDKLTNLYTGYACLAKFSDEGWYRGEVVEVEGSNITVAAIDFGFSEKLPTSRLRNTDPNFKVQPAQAVLCSLDINKQSASNWGPGETSRFKAMCERNGLVAKVLSKQGCTHVLDLYDNSEKSINTEITQSKPSQSAVSSGISKTTLSQPTVQPVVNPKTTFSQPSVQPVVKVPLPEVSVGANCTLCCTAVKPPYMYGQVTHTPVEKVANLQKDLHNYFSTNPGDPLANATVGSFCCTKYVDGGWYRAVITSLSGGKAVVGFVDFGDSVDKQVQELKALPLNLASLPQQCLLCRMDNVPATVPRDKLTTVLVNNRVDIKLIGQEDGVYPTYGVKVLDSKILELLQDKPGFNGAPSQTMGRQPRSDRASSPASPFISQKVPSGSTQEVMVTYVKDPHSFYVVLENQSSQLDDLMDRLHAYYNKLPPTAEMLQNAKLGDPCIAQFTEDKGWYRALVTGLKATGQAEVFFVDYGNNEYTQQEELKTIKPDYLKLPAQAIHCSLAGVASSKGFWSPEHTVQFTDMVEEQSFVATFKNELDQSLYEVDLADTKGSNIAQKFGAMTNTLAATRTVTAPKTFGGNMSVTVGSGWDDSSSTLQPAGFGGQSSKTQSAGFGGQSSSFGSSRPQSGGGGFGSSRPSGGGFGQQNGTGEDNSGWDDNGSSGAKKSFGGGGFGSGGDSGFGGRKSGGFGGSGGSSGFGGGSSGSGGGSSGFGGGSSGFGGSSSGFGGSSESRSFGNNAGRDGGSRDCFKCGEGGHMARDCTNPPKAGAGGGGRECYKCGEGGHMARDCTNPPKAGAGGGGRECYKCGEGGHMARDCTNPPKAGGGGGRGGGSRDCYKCGEGGHMARDCTNPPKEGAGPRRGGGGFGGGGGDRSGGFGGGGDRSGGFGGGGDRSGGFGAKTGGGFGSKPGGGGFGASNDSTKGSDDWGDGNTSSGGFGAKTGGGFGSKPGGGGGFGSQGGGFGEKSGGFGERSGGGGFGAGRSGGGFGAKAADSGFGSSSGDDWGSSVGNEPAQSGGFQKKGAGDGGMGSRSGGFGAKPSQGFGGPATGATVGDDEWGAEPVPTTTAVLASPSGDASSKGNKPDKYSPNKFSPVTLEIGEQIDVYAVYITNPDQFWCQVIRNTASLEQLMEDMNVCYNGVADGEMILSNPAVGAPCAAKFAEDNMWYRAEIVTPGKPATVVHFVDYGNSESVPTDQLKQLKQEFMTLNTQGIRCALDGVMATNKSWSEQAVADFEDMTMEKHLVAKVTGKSGGLCYMINIENTDDEVNVGESMCSKGHCSFATVKSEPVEDLVVKSPFTELDLEIGSEMDAYVSWVESPEQFWIQPVSLEDALVEFVEEIQAVYTSGQGRELIPGSIEPGTAVMAPFSEDKAWYRGFVEKVTGSMCKVRFVDYGNADTVERGQLRLPVDEILRKKAQAGMCKLVGIKPLQSSGYTSDAKDIFDGLVKDAVVKCKVIQVKDGLFSVDINVEGTNVKDYLVKAAVVKEEKETVAVKSQLGNTETLQYPPAVELMPGTTEKVIISHTDSVASFWCQLLKNEAQLDDIMAKLEEQCHSGTGVQSFPIDMACAAKFSADACWYRAKVVATYPDSVEVLFVDYGNSEKVNMTDVCLLREDLVALPPQAMQCELENASRASNRLTAKFTEQVEDKEVTAAIIDAQDGVTIVSLTLPTGENVGELLGLVNIEPTVKPTMKDVCESMASTSLNVSKAYTMSKLPSTCSVYLSNIISPAEFFVQQVSEEEKLTDLMEKVTSHCESAPGVGAMSIGMICCAKYSEDEAWYRAKVVKVDGKMATVEFVDYGNSEETSSDNLRNISDELLKIPVFALSCGLYCVNPVDGEWSKEALEKFEELTLDKELHCELIADGNKVRLRADGVDVSANLIGLATGNDTILVRDIKSESDSVDEVTDELKKVAIKVESSTCDANFPSQVVRSDPASGYISHVDEDGTFYIQLTELEDDLNKLVEQVQGAADATPLDLTTLKVDEKVIARYSEDTSWYRATVLQVKSDTVTVRFVDYGNCDVITSNDDLRAVSQQHCEKPPFAYACKFSGRSLDTPSQVEQLVEITKDKELTVTFMTQKPIYEVTLEDEELQNVADLLELPIIDAKVTTEESLPCTVNLDNMVARHADIVRATVSQGQRVKVTVSHTESPSQFWVNLVENQSRLDELLNTMFQLYTSSRDPRLHVDSVKEGDIVAALYSEDESWYRTEVISVTDQEARVFFMDHGNTEGMPLDSLRRLPVEFCSLPLQAIEVTLGGVQPTGDCWSTEARDLFAELTQDKEMLMDVGETTQPGVFTVQLLDMGLSVGDTLAARHVGVQLATPVAVSNKVRQVFSPDTSDAVIARLYEAKSTGKTGKYGFEYRDLFLDDPTVGSHDIVITMVTHPGSFWCRLDDSTYFFYQDQLQESYKESKKQLLDLNEGRKCVVEIDEEFHRATILSKSDEKLTVKLVDIGKDHTLNELQVFEIKPEFERHPQLAFQSALPRLKPVDGETWTEEAAELLEKIVLENINKETLPGPARATVVNIKDDIVLLEVKFGKKDLALILVEQGLAKIADQNVTNITEDSERSAEKTKQTLREEFGNFMNEIVGNDKEYDVLLVDCEDMDRIVFHTEEGKAVIEDMRNEIEEYVKDKEGGQGFDEDFTEGPCLAKCKEEKVWCRANLRRIVTSDDGTKTYQVFLVDYGSVLSVDRSNLLPIPEALLTTPGQAVVCSLSELEPIDGVWSDDCQAFFQEHFAGADKKLGLYVCSYSGGVHEVLLYLWEDPKKSAEKSVNLLLAELGLAVPVVGSCLELSMMANTTDFHEISMSRMDSYGDSSELDETSYDPDSSCPVDTSRITDVESSFYTLEPDTSRLTGIDTSNVSNEEPSYLTEANTSDGDVSDLTGADTTGLTETSCLTEGDISNITDADTTGVSEVDTDVGTSEADTSAHTLDGTHWKCDDCSCENLMEESILECLHCNKPRTAEMSNLSNRLCTNQILSDESEENTAISDQEDQENCRNNDQFEDKQDDNEDVETVISKTDEIVITSEGTKNMGKGGDDDTSMNVEKSEPIDKPEPIEKPRGSLCEYMYPSVSDTTNGYPSSLTDISGYTFTSWDSSRTESVVCEDCNRDISSCLDTTGCDSEFSYYVCMACRQRRVGSTSDEHVKDVTEDERIDTMENGAECSRMVEVTEEVFENLTAEEKDHEDSNGGECENVVGSGHVEFDGEKIETKEGNVDVKKLSEVLDEQVNDVTEDERIDSMEKDAECSRMVEVTEEVFEDLTGEEKDHEDSNGGECENVVGSDHVEFDGEKIETKEGNVDVEKLSEVLDEQVNDVIEVERINTMGKGAECSRMVEVTKEVFEDLTGEEKDHEDSNGGECENVVGLGIVESDGEKTETKEGNDVEKLSDVLGNNIVKKDLLADKSIGEMSMTAERADAENIRDFTVEKEVNTPSKAINKITASTEEADYVEKLEDVSEDIDKTEDSSYKIISENEPACTPDDQQEKWRSTSEVKVCGESPVEKEKSDNIEQNSQSEEIEGSVHAKCMESSDANNNASANDNSISSIEGLKVNEISSNIDATFDEQKPNLTDYNVMTEEIEIVRRTSNSDSSGTKVRIDSSVELEEFNKDHYAAFEIKQALSAFDENARISIASEVDLDIVETSSVFDLKGALSSSISEVLEISGETIDCVDLVHQKCADNSHVIDGEDSREELVSSIEEVIVVDSDSDGDKKDQFQFMSENEVIEINSETDSISDESLEMYYDCDIEMKESNKSGNTDKNEMAEVSPDNADEQVEMSVASEIETLVKEVCENAIRVAVEWIEQEQLKDVSEEDNPKRAVCEENDAPKSLQSNRSYADAVKSFKKLITTDADVEMTENDEAFETPFVETEQLSLGIDNDVSSLVLSEIDEEEMTDERDKEASDEDAEVSTVREIKDEDRGDAHALDNKADIRDEDQGVLVVSSNEGAGVDRHTQPLVNEADTRDEDKGVPGASSDERAGVDGHAQPLVNEADTRDEDKGVPGASSNEGVEMDDQASSETE